MVDRTRGRVGRASTADERRFIRWRALVPIAGWWLVMGGCGSVASAPDGTEATVRAFLAAEGVEAKMSYLAPEFRLRLWPGEELATRDEYCAMVGWDAVASGEVTVMHAETNGDTVTMRLEERNAFTELLGLPPFRLESRFEVVDGMIVEQRMRELGDPNDPSVTKQFEDALEPVLEWARATAPELLEEAVEGDVIRYDGDSARALLTLIRRYQERPDGAR